jgi:Dit-like phage tail protein
MQSYTIGQWSGGSSKSVSCFQTLHQLAAARTPVIVTTRLKTYKNMVLVAIHAPDENRTQHGLHATLTFEQIFTASIGVSNPNWSARPNETSQFTGGTIPTTPVDNTVGQNYFVEPPPITANQVTGAGNWSSNPVGSCFRALRQLRPGACYRLQFGD